MSNHNNFIKNMLEIYSFYQFDLLIYVRRKI